MMKAEHLMAAKALGGGKGVTSEPDTSGKLHAISVHPHPDGYAVHHHKVAMGHPDHNAIHGVDTHVVKGEEELASHMKEHAHKLHGIGGKFPEGGHGGEEDALA
jgi:hypothetical protein